MELIVLAIPVAIVLLYFGSDWLVDGAKNLALRLGVTPFVIGLTIVAFGSSAPEAITSFVSMNNPDIIIGNIVGSNIANVGLAIGMAAMLRPLTCSYPKIRFELYSMMMAVLAITFLSIKGWLGFFDGLVLTLLLFIFLFLVYHVKKEDTDKNELRPQKDVNINLSKSIIMLAAGLIMLFFGARLFVDGAVELAEIFGVSELMIGLLVVAFGTVLPELCICLMAAWKGESEIVVSNIVGSMIFNSFFALGVGAMITTIPTTDPMLVYHMAMMVILAAALFAVVKMKNSVTRPVGTIFMSAYLLYVVFILMN